MNLKRLNLFKNLVKNKNFSHIFKSIRVLYMVKVHPEYLKKDRLEFKTIIKKITVRYYNYIKNIFSLSYSQKYNKLKKKRIIVISHLLNEKKLNKKDFYFGNLGKILKKNKISHQFLLINHTKKNSIYLNNKIKISNNIVIDDYLNFLMEINIFILQIKELFLIFLRIRIIGYSNLKEILFSLFSSQTKNSIRLYFLMNKYLEKINPKFLISTYEGFPWERQVFKATKDFDKNIKTIGYQNIFLTSNYKSIFLSLKDGFDPDRIWVPGEFPKHLFEKSELKNKKIYIVGKLKNDKIIFNQKYLKKNQKTNKCLIIPEGIYSECLKLFKFSYECSLLNKNLKFIWRVHPVIDIKKVLFEMNLNFESLPRNIIISKEKNILKDIFKSKFALYRGSNAIITAIKTGITPIYLDTLNGPNIDLLRLYKKYNNYVNNPKQLADLIINSSNMKKTNIEKLNKFINKNEFKINEKLILNSLR